MTNAPAPRVLVVLPEQWPRALLRAALREQGYDAAGALNVAGAAAQPVHSASRGPVSAVLLDASAVTAGERDQLDRLRARFPGAAFVLIARTTTAEPAGPWTRTLRRPLGVDRAVRAVRELVPLSPSQRRPIDAR